MDRLREYDPLPLSLGRAGLSGSLVGSVLNGDLARFTSFFAPRDSERARPDVLFEKEPACMESSSTDVAAVVAEVCEKRPMLLPAVLTEPVSVELRLSAVRARLWPFMEPAKKSPMPEPGRAPKRFREITSSPNIAARDRDAVGVVGRETLPVLNLKRPYWWTVT